MWDSKISHLGVPVIFEQKQRWITMNISMTWLNLVNVFSACRHCCPPVIHHVSIGRFFMTWLSSCLHTFCRWHVSMARGLPKCIPEVNTIDSSVIPHFRHLISSSLEAYKIRCLETPEVIFPPSFHTPRAFFEHEHGMLTHSFLAIWRALTLFQATTAAVQVLYHCHHRWRNSGRSQKLESYSRPR